MIIQQLIVVTTFQIYSELLVIQARVYYFIESIWV